LGKGPGNGPFCCRQAAAVTVEVQVRLLRRICVAVELSRGLS